MVSGSTGVTTQLLNALLDLYTLAEGERFGRITPAHYPDPLSFGKMPSCFSDPRRRV